MFYTFSDAKYLMGIPVVTCASSDTGCPSGPATGWTWVCQDDIQKNNAFDHDGHGILRYIYINDTHHFWTKRKRLIKSDLQPQAGTLRDGCQIQLRSLCCLFLLAGWVRKKSHTHTYIYIYMHTNIYIYILSIYAAYVIVLYMQICQ